MASFMPSILVMGCCTIQWFMFGYSLAYGEGSGIIGDFKYAFHRGVLADPVGTIPAILFSEFQLIFCATVCAIAVGGAVERGRVVSLIPFIFVSLRPSLTQSTITDRVTSFGQPSFTAHLPTWFGQIPASSATLGFLTSQAEHQYTSAVEQQHQLSQSTSLILFSARRNHQPARPHTSNFTDPANQCSNFWHYSQPELQIRHGLMRHQSLCLWWFNNLGLYYLL
jgi:hypothetical protein